jgi:sulfite exporter TauE/SafE
METGWLSVMAWCGAAVPLGGGVVLALLLAGLVGSPMHCVPMCGGFVLGQVADGMARVPLGPLCAWRRLRAGLLLPYHLGRLSTYAALGAIAGAGGGALVRLPWFGRLSGVLLLAAAMLFLIQALHRLAPRFGPRLGSGYAPALWLRLLGRITDRIGRDSRAGGYLLGVVLGLLPCGFLYGGLAAAAGAGSGTVGAAGMLAFGLGTVPGLLMVGLGGQVAARRWQAGLTRVSAAVMLCNAALLVGLAMRGLA